MLLLHFHCISCHAIIVGAAAATGVIHTCLPLPWAVNFYNVRLLHHHLSGACRGSTPPCCRVRPCFCRLLPTCCCYRALQNMPAVPGTMHRVPCRSAMSNSGYRRYLMAISCDSSLFREGVIPPRPACAIYHLAVAVRCRQCLRLAAFCRCSCWALLHFYPPGRKIGAVHGLDFFRRPLRILFLVGGSVTCCTGLQAWLQAATDLRYACAIRIFVIYPLPAAVHRMEMGVPDDDIRTAPYELLQNTSTNTI